MCASQIGAGEIGATHVAADETGAKQIGAAQIGAHELAAVKDCTDEFRPLQNPARKIKLDRFEHTEIEPLSFSQLMNEPLMLRNQSIDGSLAQHSMSA